MLRRTTHGDIGLIGAEPARAERITFSSAYVEIKITDETNTRAEKAAYIRAVFEGLSALMPNLHHESYIHVHDARAGAYGYGGLTQEYRAQHG